MNRYVLDASALMVFFESRPGADKVKALLRAAAEARRSLLTAVVNWGEVYYSVWATRGEAAANDKAEQIAQLPIEVVAVDMEMARMAASLKARHKLPYADSFAAALAQKHKSTLVTTDSDFLRVAKEINILWANEPERPKMPE